MIVEVDAGNSRVKWRLREEDGKRAGGAALIARAEPGTVVADLLNALRDALQQQGYGWQDVTTMNVASVRGAGFRKALEQQLPGLCRIQPSFISVQRHWAGMTVAYEEPALLGVDRWLAMLAAREEAGQQAICVVSAGSALTVDRIEADGRHLGGYIVPGLNMMLEALAARSQALRYGDRRRWGLCEPGRDTRSAMENGAMMMALGMLEKTERQWPGMAWYLCGGDAPLLVEHLGWPVRLRSELVLDGIALAAGHGNTVV